MTLRVTAREFLRGTPRRLGLTRSTIDKIFLLNEKPFGMSCVLTASVR